MTDTTDPVAPRRARSLHDIVPGELDPTGKWMCYAEPPFHRPWPPQPPDPEAEARHAQAEAARVAARLARFTRWIASLPEDERETEPDPRTPGLLRQTWAASLRTQARVDPVGYAIYREREEHFIRHGYDKPWAAIRVYHRKPPRWSRPASPARAAAATGRSRRDAAPTTRGV